MEYRSVPVRKASPTRQPSPAKQMIVVVQQPVPAAAASSTPRPAASTPRSPNSAAPSEAATGSVNLDNFETNPCKNVLTSPRSLHACTQLGIHPTELIPRPLSQFMGSGVPQSIAQLRHGHYEARRQQKLQALREARSQMVQPATTAKSVPAAQTSTPRPPSPRSSTPQPVSRSRQPSPRPLSTKPLTVVTTSTTATVLPVQRVQAAILDNQRRRSEAYERAQRLTAEREAKVLEKQNDQAERCRSQLQAIHQERLVEQEVRRLRLVDVKEHVQQLRRIDQYRSAVKADEWERKVANRVVDRTAILAARVEYLTPRQREEKKRSSSALR